MYIDNKKLPRLGTCTTKIAGELNFIFFGKNFLVFLTSMAIRHVSENNLSVMVTMLHFILPEVYGTITKAGYVSFNLRFLVLSKI